MPQASTVRATASGQGRRQDRPGSHWLRHVLLSAGAALLAGAAPAAAQQYGSIGASVTVDYGVLDSLGGGPNLPAMLAYPQAPYAPYAAPGAAPAGQLLSPPSTPPRSTMTGGQAMAGQEGTPPGGELIRLIPPSQIKETPPVPAAAPQPTQPAATQPQPTQPAATQPAVTQPAPPPPPTEIAAAPAATPPAPATPTPPAATVPMPEAPAVTEAAPATPAPTQQAAADVPPPPAPEPEPAPAAAPPAAAPEPEAVPAAEAASGMSVGGALGDTGDAAADAAPATPAAETPAPEQSLADAGKAESENAGAGAEDGSGQADTALFPSVDPEPADAEPAATGSEDTQTAALPPQSMVEGQVSIGFEAGASELSPDARSSLDTVADRLRIDDGLRVQLLAYAAALDDNSSRARRMSLSRALAVRAYLIEKGVRSTRMDVRALGSNVEGEPADRVDIIPQAQ